MQEYRSTGGDWVIKAKHDAKQAELAKAKAEVKKVVVKKIAVKKETIIEKVKKVVSKKK